MDLFSIGAMDAGLWIQYIAIFFVLVAMEGLLSADNALVLAVMVRPLSPKLRSKALFYGSSAPSCCASPRSFSSAFSPMSGRRRPLALFI